MASPKTFMSVKDFRPKEAEEYYPEETSALNAVHTQGRGSSVNERNQSDTRKHTHDGINSEQINIFSLAGFIRTVTAAPTYEPKSFAEQFVLYASGGTFRLYIYDVLNKAWRYATLT